MKLNKVALILSGLAAMVLVTGCTAKQRARSFGGEDRVELACGQKLFDITWKEDTLWTATRAMHPDEEPETYTYQADSSYGVFEGTVTIVERRCPS